MSRELAIAARQISETWLRGWGCEIEHLTFCVAVRHKEFSDYNAIYDIRSPMDMPAVLSLAQAPGRFFAWSPIVLLPNSSEFDEAARNLPANGYVASYRSETLAAGGFEIAPDRTMSDVVFRPVTRDTISLWIQLYERNYQLPATASHSNRERWLHMFATEPAVEFLLVEKGTVVCGTMQIIQSGQLGCAVYSLSIPIALRGFNNFRSITVALKHLASVRKCEWLFFDRLRPLVRHPFVRRQPSFHLRLRPWHIISSDVGYRLEVKDNGDAT